jgi:cytochrome c peroxidase
MEGSATLAVLSADDAAAADGYGGFTTVPTAHMATGAGPRGVAVAGDTAWIHTFLDRGVGSVPLDRLTDALPAAPGDPAVVAVPALSKPVVPGVLDAVTEAGRGFFYGATDPRFVTASAGVSCATCHFEGRNDGMTWPTDHGIRSTPSLAGRVSDTVPMTWTAGVATVFEEARLTSQERLGGRGATDAELAALATFIDFTREVDVPEKGAVTAQTERGRTLFERADVGCASCHWGPRLTDQNSHPLYGLEAVDTPSLTGVAVTAPYLHDGRAATLRDVLETAREGAMGDASMLSEQDLDDLEAYLRTL